jgi:hypothetical protein
MATKEDQNKDWAEMSDGEEPEVETPEEEKARLTIKKKKIPAAAKGFKNKQGGYVVTKIDIPDTRQGVNKDEDGEAKEESDEDTEYHEEDETKEENKKTDAVNQGK